MFCLNCGERLKDNEIFCHYCGTPVDSNKNRSDGIEYYMKKKEEINKNNNLMEEKNIINNNDGINGSLNPRKGVYMERREPLVNELSKKKFMWPLVGGIVGLVFGLLVTSISSMLMLIVAGIIVGFSLLQQNSETKKRGLNDKQFYLPKNITNEQAYALLKRFEEKENMKVEQTKNGTVRITYRELIYDVIINNKLGTFRLWASWPNKKYWLTPIIIIRFYSKRDYLKEIEGMGMLAYLLQHSIMGEI